METDNAVEMETDNAVRRLDGSIIQGLTLERWKEYQDEYHYLQEDELIHIRDVMIQRPSDSPFDHFIFESFAEDINDEKAIESLHGIHASHATSLFMLLSVNVKPRKRKFSSLLVYGEITSASSDRGVYMYKRESGDVENFDPDGGYLTLNGPSALCSSRDVGFLLQGKELSIRLYDQQRQPLYPLVDEDNEGPIILDYSEGYFEEVKQKVVQNTEISITLKYVSIPMAVYGHLTFRILRRDSENINLKRGDDPNLFINVFGNVVANSINKFGNYKSQKSVLFDKNPDLHQPVKLHLGKGKNLLSSSGSRCWVVAPACSSLQLHIDLFNSSSNEIILKQDVELETLNDNRSSKDLVFGKYFISVCASWYPYFIRPPAQGGCDGQIFRSPEPHPRSASAMEVFSVLLVCHEKPLQIHGHLRLAPIRSSNFKERGIDIFKSEEEKPLPLNGSRLHTIPVLNGSIFLADSSEDSDEDFDEWSMTCDLKDTISKSSIKGYEQLNVYYYCRQQLCSIFRGGYGFAVLHYTVFLSAVQVKLKLYARHQRGLQCDIRGSIFAQYKNFDYSSEYKRNCYRIVLFNRNMNAQMDEDGLIPLSRSTFFVPLSSSAMLDLDLRIGTQEVVGQIDVVVGMGKTTKRIIEGEIEVEVVLDWD